LEGSREKDIAETISVERKIVSIADCPEYSREVVRGAVREVLKPFGGMSAFVNPGDRVLLKPNLLSAKAPERAITTHPLIVEAVAEEVREAGAEPFIADSPGGAIRGIDRVWENTGMKEMAERNGIELVNLEASGVEGISFNKYTFYISKPVLEADVIINLPKLKTHSLTLLTCAVKNMFGVIPGFRKSEMHKLYPKPEEFAEMLVHLYKLVTPSLNIVDAVVAMAGNGPSAGSPYKLGVLIAGTDAVAVDAVSADIIGFEDGMIDTTRIASQMGLGEGELSSINVVGKRPELTDGDFSLPSNRALRLVPKFLVRLVAPLVWVKPVIDPSRCTGCGFCAQSCPVQTIKRDGKVYRIDDSKCINCLCCHELCPEHCIEIEMSWLARRFA